MKHKVKHIHFVGIGGAGMSGIAEVLANLGFTVSGSDLAESATTRRLAGAGVRSLSAMPAVTSGAPMRWSLSDGSEGRQPGSRRRAREEGAGGAARADAGRTDAPEAGASPLPARTAKTTTTSLVASILAEGALDPTFVIGGRLNAAGANARLGSGDFIVAEADDPTPPSSS